METIKCPKCESTEIVDGVCTNCGLNIAQWEAENPVCSKCGNRHPESMEGMVDNLMGSLPPELAEVLKDVLGGGDVSPEMEAVARAADSIDDRINEHAGDSEALQPESFEGAAMRAVTRLEGIAGQVDTDLWQAIQDARETMAVMGTITTTLSPVLQEHRGDLHAYGRIAFVLGYDAGKGVREAITA